MSCSERKVQDMRTVMVLNIALAAIFRKHRSCVWECLLPKIGFSARGISADVGQGDQRFVPC